MKQKTTKKIFFWINVSVVSVILGVSLQLANAWTPPPTDPPASNIGAPINTGSVGQTKVGGVMLNCGTGVNCTPNGTSATNGLLVPNGNVGIGTMVPSTKLDVVGDVKGTRLCIGDDCRDAWPSGGGAAIYGD